MFCFMCFIVCFVLFVIYFIFIFICFTLILVPSGMLYLFHVLFITACILFLFFIWIYTSFKNNFNYEFKCYFAMVI